MGWFKIAGSSSGSAIGEVKTDGGAYVRFRVGGLPRSICLMVVMDQEQKMPIILFERENLFIKQDMV